MDGLEGAVTTVVDRLTAALPAKTTELRTRYGVDAETEGHLLPDVVTVAAYDKHALALEEWPAVLVSGLETMDMTRVDVDGAIEHWLVRYQLRVFIWVRSEDPVSVWKARNRLTLAVRELLMTRRTMNTALMVDEATLTESYSDLAVDEDKATVGGAFVAVQVLVAEELTGETPDYGEVGSPPALDTTHLPPHPGL